MMRIKNFKAPLVIALAYWVFSSIVLLDDIFLQNSFPMWLHWLALPGNLFGVIFYWASPAWAVVGQFISLILMVTLFAIIIAVCKGMIRLVKG